MNETASDKSWEADCDARTLIEAGIILNDPKKKTAALKAMRVMIKDKKDDIACMRDILDTGTLGDADLDDLDK